MKKYCEYLCEGRVAIFLLHGVVRSSESRIRNYTRKHLPVEDFEALLISLKSEGNAVSMDEVKTALSGKSPLPDRAFAITFDDGFENNYSVAAPALEAHGIPAMFYVTSDFINHNSVSWIDRIEYAVEKSERITLSSMHEAVDGSYVSKEEKVALLDSIRRLVKFDSSVDPYAFAETVCDAIAAEPMVHDAQLDAKMNWQQVRNLARHPLFSVGGHGKTHRILSHLSPEELEEELDTGMQQLNAAVNCKVSHFSYPEGLRHCYSDRVIEALRRRGIDCAVTAEAGDNGVGDDLFRLKRIMVV